MYYLSEIPEDLLQHIVSFLPAKDFYSLKIVIKNIDDGIFWYNIPISLQQAVRVENSSLVRWILNNTVIYPRDVIQIVHLTTNILVHKQLYTKFLNTWPAQISLLTNTFVAAGNNQMFNHLISRNPATVTQDTADCAYAHEKWIMMSCIFAKAPKIFIEYVFGSYKYAADPEVILNLRYVLLYLYPSERLILTGILKKYHEWLWNKMLTTNRTLATIVAIHKLEIFTFVPSCYVKRAMSSPAPDYLEYLLLKGLLYDPSLLLLTNDVDKLKLVYAANVVQKYHKIMVMLMLLLTVVVGNLLLSNTKIESSWRKNTSKHVTTAKSQTILHSQPNSGWRFGISSGTEIYQTRQQVATIS